MHIVIVNYASVKHLYIDCYLKKYVLANCISYFYNIVTLPILKCAVRLCRKEGNILVLNAVNTFYLQLFSLG